MKVYTKLVALICATAVAGMVLAATAQQARADCPDLPVRCGKNKVGWQGYCLKGFKGCKRCGPAHCKKRPSEKQVKKKPVPRHEKGRACRKVVRDYVHDRDKNKFSNCSIPKGVKKAFVLAELVFGKSACFEHDICYYLPGVSRKACDKAFLTNMKANCRQANLRKLGTADCRIAARLFYTSVRTFAGNKRKASTLRVCKKIPDNQ